MATLMGKPHYFRIPSKNDLFDLSKSGDQRCNSLLSKVGIQSTAK